MKKETDSNNKMTPTPPPKRPKARSTKEEFLLPGACQYRATIKNYT